VELFYKTTWLFSRSGIYELQLMQKKSMSIRDYRKKVEIFDKFTNNKSPDEVESLVSHFSEKNHGILYNSFGETSGLANRYTVLISQDLCSMTE